MASIDPKTGEKTINQAAIPHIGQTTVNCPADPGGRGWPATAYSPKTGILYMPLNEYCSNTTPTPLDPGQAYTGGGRAVFARVPVPNSDGKIGRVDAIKLADRSQVWSYRLRAPETPDPGLLTPGRGRFTRLDPTVRAETPDRGPYPDETGLCGPAGLL